MYEYKRKLLEFIKSPKKSVLDIEKRVTEYFIRLLDKSRKAGFWISLADIKTFTQEEGLTFEKRVKDILEQQNE